MGHLRERDAERAAIEAAVATARAGSGGIVLVEGPAGAGKSALLEQAAARATGGGARVLHARGGELESGFAFGAVRQLFESLLLAADVHRRTRLLAGPAAPSARVLGASSDGEGRAADAFSVLSGLARLTARIAAETPLVLVLDDVQWFDEPSVRWLDFLARRVGELPVCVIVAVRSGESGTHVAVLDALRDAARTTLVRPGPLSAEAVAAVLDDERPDAGADLAAAYAEASAGNPLYLRELLRLGPVPLPAIRDAAIREVGDRVVRRVRALDPQAPGLAVAVAVLGDGIRVGLAAALAGLPEPEATQLVLLLQRSEIFAPGDRLGFIHPVVRGSIYETLSATERAAAHREAARLLTEAAAPAEAVAAHLARVPPASSPSAVEQLRAAAREALDRAAPDVAAAHLRRALAEGGTRASRAELLFELGRAQMATRDVAAFDTLREARALAEDTALLIRVTATLGELLGLAGMWAEAVGVLRETKARVGHGDPGSVELDAIRAAVMANDPMLVGGLDRDRRALTLAASGTTWAARALTSVLANVASVRGEGREAVFALLDHALADDVLLERDAGGWPTGQLLEVLVEHDEHERTLALCGRIEQAASTGGVVAGLLAALLGRTVVHARRGELREAEAGLREGLEISLEAQMPMWLATAVRGAVEALVERPGLADMVAFVDGVVLEPQFAASTSGAMLREARGRVALANGDRARAVGELRGAAEVYAALGHGPVRTTWRSALALAIAPAEPVEALRLAAEELTLARAAGARRAEGVALRTVGLLAPGADGIALLRDSVATLAPTAARYELALSWVELGAALRRAQQRTEARAALVTGGGLAARCGAERLAARADDELRVAGARPRRRAEDGAEVLTASEARVAELAAVGHSNLEIAQELYLGLKTVETHLSHAYAKLGLAGQGSRRRLAAVLPQGDD